MFKHTAIDPNGKVHKRNSKGRQYSHTVLYRCSYDHELDIAKNGTHCDPDNYAYYKAYVNGTSRFLARKPWEQDDAAYEERKAIVVADALEKLHGDPEISYADFRARNVADRVALVEAKKAEGYYELWRNAGWCGRLDLAQKLQASTGPGSIIIEAQIA